MLPFSAAKVLCGVPPGGKTAAERPVQVEAATASGAVQRFPHEVQPRTAPELEGRFHLGQGKPAAGGLRLPPAAGGEPLEPPVLGNVGELLPAACGQGVGGSIRQGGGSPEGAAKLAVQKLSLIHI